MSVLPEGEKQENEKQNKSLKWKLHGRTSIKSVEFKLFQGIGIVIVTVPLQGQGFEFENSMKILRYVTVRK